MHTGPNMANDGLVFYYDTGNTRKSFKGEPTVNLAPETKLSHMQSITIVDLGYENGWRKYSLSGSWIDNTYPYSLMIPVSIPFTGGVSYSASCKIKTNVLHKFEYKFNKLRYVNAAMNSSGVGFREDLGNGEFLVGIKNFEYTSNTTQGTYIDSRPVNGTTFNPSIDFVWVKEFQVEQKPHATPFTPSTRSATESLLDLTGNSVIDVSAAGFDSNGLPTYNGSNNYSIINNNFLGTVTELTTSVWFRKNGEGSNYECALHKGTSNTVGSSDYWTGVDLNNYLNATIGGSVVGQAAGLTTELIVYGEWYNLVATWDGAVVRVFINGVFNKQYNLASYNNIDFPTRIGASSDGAHYQLNGDVPIVQIYNKSMTDLQVKQNFNALKSRFGI